MHIAADNIALRIGYAIDLATHVQPRAALRVKLVHTGMYLISIDVHAVQLCQPAGLGAYLAGRLHGGLFVAEHHVHVQQPQSSDLGHARFDVMRIAQPVAQHLISAAHAHDQSTRARMADYRGVYAARAQFQQILNRVLGAGQYYDVRALQLARAGDIPHLCAAGKRQRLKVGKVRYMAQPYHGHVNVATARHAAQPLGHAVLVLQLDVHPRHHAQHRHAYALLQHSQPRLQYLYVAAKLVDYDALHARALIVLQQHHRAQQRRKYAAQVYVAHQYYRRVGSLGHGHIDYVALAQIDLGRRTCAFQHHKVNAPLKFVVRLLDHAAQLGLVVVVLHGGHAAQRTAVDYDL